MQRSAANNSKLNLNKVQEAFMLGKELLVARATRRRRRTLVGLHLGNFAAPARKISPGTAKYLR